MIVSILSNKALWFDYDLKSAKKVGFKEAIDLILKSSGYTIEDVKAQFDIRYKEPLIPFYTSIRSQTLDGFYREAYNYLSSFEKGGFSQDIESISISVITDENHHRDGAKIAHQFINVLAKALY